MCDKSYLAIGGSTSATIINVKGGYEISVCTHKVEEEDGEAVVPSDSVPFSNDLWKNGLSGFSDGKGGFK